MNSKYYREHLQHYHNVYIFDDVKTDLKFTHGLWNIKLITYMREGQRFIQAPSNIYDGIFSKNS